MDNNTDDTLYMYIYIYTRVASHIYICEINSSRPDVFLISVVPEETFEYWYLL